MPGHPELDAGGPMRRKMVGLATEGRYFWTNVLCQAAVNLCSKALLFLKYRALLVQRGPARLARGASHPGCGSQHPQRFACVLLAAAQPAPAGVKPFIKKHWKPITAAICAAVVAAAVLVPKNSAKPAAASAQYVETRPEKRNIVNSYSADGTITAADTYTVKPMVKGTVLTADFEVGDTVNKGDVRYLRFELPRDDAGRR